MQKVPQEAEVRPVRGPVPPGEISTSSPTEMGQVTVGERFRVGARKRLRFFRAYPSTEKRRSFVQKAIKRRFLGHYTCPDWGNTSHTPLFRNW